jgi:hypothetical protein
MESTATRNHGWRKIAALPNTLGLRTDAWSVRSGPAAGSDPQHVGPPVNRPVLRLKSPLALRERGNGLSD